MTFAKSKRVVLYVPFLYHYDMPVTRPSSKYVIMEHSARSIRHTFKSVNDKWTKFAVSIFPGQKALGHSAVNAYERKKKKSEM